MGLRRYILNNAIESVLFFCLSWAKKQTYPLIHNLSTLKITWQLAHSWCA